MAWHIWNGSSWQTLNYLSYWNGSSWVTSANAKVWNGSSWVSFVDKVELTNNHTFDTGYKVNVATWQITNAGMVYYNQNNTTNGYPWLINTGNTNKYQVNASFSIELGSPNIGGDATNTWLDCSTTRSWYLSAYAEDVDATLTVQIRHKDTLDIIDTAYISYSLISTA